ncbi:hypothetical protein ACF08N_00400 [Streptomyces sp. NPDC015127]|uniref:hypothetical protein n=1 Tax=Streptomyces sp. NPDC015127 TaxID=3364939 RepID=UPI0036F56AD6
MTSPTGFDDRYDEPDQLRDQLRQLLRYRATIALGIVLGLLAGLLLTLFRVGSYTSTGEVLVRSTTDPFSPFGVSVENQVSMGTERQIALSATVAARAAKDLREPSRSAVLLKDLRVSNPPETQVLRFEYTAGTAQRAARVANAFVDAYLADRKDRTDATVKRMTEGLEQQVARLTKKISKKANTAQDASLRDQINTMQKRISDIESRDTSGGDVVREAEPPALPSGPGTAMLLSTGVVGGLFLGILLAWLRTALEPRARSVSEVQRALGAPVLGIVPGAAMDGELLDVGRTGGGRAETYRTIAFRIRPAEARTAVRTLLVVSPKPDHLAAEAAEAAAVNLAAAFAESGDDVLLVDATASAPGLAARLPLVPEDDVDTELARLSDDQVVVDAGTAGRFTLFPDTRGTTADHVPAPPAATRVLPSADFGMSALVLARPLLEHADSLAVAQRVDGVLVVGGLDRLRREDLKRVRELVSCSGGHIVGAVLDTGKRENRLARVRSVLDDALNRCLKKRSSTTPSEDRAGDLSAAAQDAPAATQEEAAAPPEQESSGQDATVTTSRG